MYIYKKTMYTHCHPSYSLHTYKTHNYTTHGTPELWRGAAGLCARVYARVLVPPNLYIHTYITQHTLHCTQAHN